MNRGQLQPKIIIGPDDQPMRIDRRLVLGLRHLKKPYPHNRLIWIWSGEEWLCQEEKRKLKKPDEAREVGRMLAREYGVPFRTWVIA